MLTFLIIWAIGYFANCYILISGFQEAEAAGDVDTCKHKTFCHISSIIIWPISLGYFIYLMVRGDSN